jgi:acyl-CoA synthetase (AMP-forming)/AMP-acid ligase II
LQNARWPAIVRAVDANAATEDETTADETTLAALLSAIAAQRRSAPFLAIAGETVTGSEFAARVRSTADGLRRAGLGEGDRLAVHLHRSVDEAVVLLAAMAIGALAVPLNPKLKDDQVAHVLADSEPFAVIGSATKEALLREPARVYARLRVFHAREPLQCLPSVPLPVGDAGAPLPVLAPRTPAAILYTSGSTGLAKGIVQDHRNLLRGAAIVAGYLGLAPADHILALLPFSFDYGLNQLLSALHSGCRITAADHLGAGELGELLAAVRPTGLAGVPSLWHEVARGLDGGALTAAHGASLRYVTNSGGRLQPQDLGALRVHWPHVRVFAMYGLTEAFRSAFLPPELLLEHPDSFGRALPGVELLLVDPDSGTVLDGPATGELVHAGALVAHGYWRQPAATAQRFRPDPRGRDGTVVFSGDLVRRDAEGLHYFVGRRDRLLKVHGHRVSPDEVAAAVAGCPGAGEIAVFGRDAGAQGHRLVLCLSGDPADADLAPRVLRLCKSRLPAYMVPAAVLVLRELPHNHNGKVDVDLLQRTFGPCIEAG